MGCFDCICETKKDFFDEEGSYCQLSMCNTFNNYGDFEWESYEGNCPFYNSNRKEFVNNILRIHKHKGNNFDFSNLKMTEYEHLDYDEYITARAIFIPKKDMYLKNFQKLLNGENRLWDKKIEAIYFYDNGDVSLYTDYYGEIEVDITKEDIEKFELLVALYFRQDKKTVKDILMYME